MVKKFTRNTERRLPYLSISIEFSLAEEFKLACANNDSKVSIEVRKFILSYLKREREKERKNVKK